MDFYTFLPKILNMSLTASVAIVFVLLLRLLLKKAPKIISYALWGVVLIRLLCPVSIESGLSLFGLFDTPTASMTDRTSAVEYIPSNIVHTEYPEVVLPVPGIGEAITEALPQGEEQLRADPLEAPVSISTYVWAAGVLVMAVYGFVTYLRLRRRLVTASPLRDNIYLADEIDSPFVMGLIRPKIYLPSAMEEREQSYIILHEQHHIRRLDHIVKALAFVALCVHWFNPLVWVAFILSGKDMEMSCDEAVVRKLGTEIRADYSASLLSLATGKRIIAGMPLAFGEGNTKGRIKNLANWKKPAFWVVLVAIVACIVLAVCLLTNPPAEREFPINGQNVSELDTDRVIEKIIAAENLEHGSQLCVDADNFDLMFTPDFDWANDGAIRFFYGKNQKYYSAQLRMFHDENKYFITERSEWIEPDNVFKLFHYLDSLKYMPQEEIRQLSPDADGYSVMHVLDGAPGDYDRVLKYSKNGVNDNDGWYIHLEVLPLHEVNGAYNGSGDEVIHLFYNSGDPRDDIAGKTYLYENEGIMGDFIITLYEDGTFTYYEGMASSYLGTGSFMMDGDIITMTDDGHGGYGLVNHFRRDGGDLVFVEQESDNFVYVKVKDGERFHCTGEAFKQNNESTGADLIDAFKRSIGADETIIVTDHVYADDEAYGLEGVVQYADETGTPWKLAFIRDGVAFPTSMDFSAEYRIASELTYLGNGAVQVHVENLNDGTFYVCRMEYSYDETEKQTNFKAITEEYRGLTAEEIAQINETFSPIVFDKQGNPIGVNTWSCFFTSYYDDVREMNFEEFLAYFPGDGSTVDEEEFAALKELENFLFYGEVSKLSDMPVPVHRYPRRIVDLVLGEYAGISTADLDTSGVEYLPDYDAFYNYTSDAGHGMFRCTRGEVEGDIVRLYEEFDYGTDMLTLRKVGNSYHIVAHQNISES